MNNQVCRRLHVHPVGPHRFIWGKLFGPNMLFIWLGCRYGGNIPQGLKFHIWRSSLKFRLFTFVLRWGVLDLGCGLLGFLGGGVLDLTFGLRDSVLDFNEDLLGTLISSLLSMATNLSFKSIYFGFDSKGFTLLVSLSNLTFFYFASWSFGWIIS